MKKSSKKGFTLAELLIVIAIIAILVAIMFPVFGAQLDKAKAAADLANVRSKYSELVADSMLKDGNITDAATMGNVSIGLDKLDDDVQYDSKVYRSTDGTTDAGVGTGGYILVKYSEKYYGSFKIDNDVTITATSPAETPAETPAS